MTLHDLRVIADSGDEVKIACAAIVRYLKEG